jgi:hypothetical protein
MTNGIARVNFSMEVRGLAARLRADLGRHCFLHELVE